MEHKQLRHDMAALVREVPALVDSRRFDKPLVALDQGDTPEDLALEYEYVKTYRDLVNVLDDLMTMENASANEEYEKRVDALKLVHDYVGDGDVHVDENKQEYLRQMQHIRKMVIESVISTLPILRAVHHVEGISTKESALLGKIELRDTISRQIIELQKDVRRRNTVFSAISNETALLLQDARTLTKGITSSRQQEKLTPEEEQRLKELKVEHAKYRQKSEKFAEEIESMMVDGSIDWAEDPKYLEIVELCGSLYASE